MRHLRPVLESLEGKRLLSHVHAVHVHALPHPVQTIVLAPAPVFPPVTAPTVSAPSAINTHPAVWGYPMTPSIYLLGRNPLIPNPVPGTNACIATFAGGTTSLNITVPVPPLMPQR
jgi:hypothetical protein